MLDFHSGAHLLSRRDFSERKRTKPDFNLQNAGEGNKKELFSDDVTGSDEFDDVHCGIGLLRPSCLQPLAKVSAFVGFIGIAGFLSSCLSVYITSQITTLERTFSFGSATSGVILACNDIGYLICILFASYFARRTHIPRVMYLVTLFYGIAALICCVPYFITSDKFRLSNVNLLQTQSKNSSRSSSKMSANLCLRNKTAFDIISSSACDDIDSGDQSASLFGLTQYESNIAVVLIASGMILQGFTKAPRSAFISTYIDDNSKKTKSPGYIGTVFGISIFGPAVAFSVGGLFSRIYVTLEASDMNYRDPRWIGAWWLGFLVFGIAAILFATPLLFFPRHLLPKSKRLSLKESGEKQPLNKSDLKGLLKALARLFTNPVYCPLVFAQILEQTGVSGGLAFTAKYIETLFHIPVWKANLIMGGCAILAAAAGAFLGGRIISRFKLSLVACTKMLVVLYTIYLFFQIPFFFLDCPQTEVRGDWNAIGVKYGHMLNDTSCLNNCFCDKVPFRPVCDTEQGVTYYSACHAGCKTKNGTMFQDCSCIPSGEVLSGYCPSNCNTLTLYIIFLILEALSGATCIMCFITIVMRSVSETDKPLALGLNSFLNNLLGSMPGPILFGALIDTICLIWNTKCDRVGSCALYDRDDFRYKFNALQMGCRVISLMLLFVVLRNAIKKRSCQTKRETHYEEILLNGVKSSHDSESDHQNEDNEKVCSEIGQGH